MIYPIGTYLLAFHLDMGIEGIWMAKINLEWCLIVGYLLIINSTDWYDVAEKCQIELEK